MKTIYYEKNTTFPAPLAANDSWQPVMFLHSIALGAGGIAA